MSTKKMKMEEEKKVDDGIKALAAVVEAKPVVSIKNLTFCYDKASGKKNLDGLNCCIEPNSKIILVGANGAGKSTLLRILTGQIFMGLESDEFDINGRKSANDQANGVAYLGGTWKRRRTGFEGVCPYTMDCAASEMMAKWQENNIERRDELVRVLGINLNWRMHECSDGQRKKVRIMIKLLRPFQLCIIDEFAADLDIFSRSRFFNYLTKECKERGASVVYATHIFDQADAWASHIAFMQLNKTLSPIHRLTEYEPYHEVLSRVGKERAFCPMYVLVLEELERQYRSQTDVFGEGCYGDDDDDDNACLMDVIMGEQSKELAGDRFESERAGDQTGWVSGRLTRQLAAAEQKVRREERMEKTRREQEQETESEKLEIQ
jgi:CCR4-NOT complex subunit CAF16